ncbi:hypothetical protein ACOMHN_059191 [Nucella lapillus]
MGHARRGDRSPIDIRGAEKSHFDRDRQTKEEEARPCAERFARQAANDAHTLAKQQVSEDGKAQDCRAAVTCSKCHTWTVEMSTRSGLQCCMDSGDVDTEWTAGLHGQWRCRHGVDCSAAWTVEMSTRSGLQCCMDSGDVDTEWTAGLHGQ